MAKLKSENGNNDDWKSARAGLPQKAFYRSKNGCGTCRIRKVKCDETKPICKRCLSTERKCDGYSMPVTHKRGSAPVALLIVPITRHPDLNVQSRVSIDFFRSKSALALRNHETQNFWSGLVLAAAETEQCIRDLVIAVACLDMTASTTAGQILTSVRPSYLVHYGRALQTLVHTKDPGLMLIACVIFVLCADYEQNPYAAITHIQSGRRLIASIGNIPSGDSLLDLKTIVDLLWQHSPELSSRNSSVFRPPFSQNLPVTSGSSPAITDHFVDSFGSVAEATYTLQALIPQCIAKKPYGIPPPTRFHVVPGVTENLNRWLRMFNNLVPRLDNHGDFLTYTKTHILRAYHLIAVIASRCEGFGNEMLFDNHGNDLDGLIKKIHLFSEQGAGNSLKAAMFWVICKSRDAAGRRSLTNLLRYQACGLEGAYLAEVAESVIRAEECGLDNPITSDDIPETSRVCVRGLAQAQDGTGGLLECEAFSRGQLSGTRLITLDYDGEAIKSKDSFWKAEVLANALILHFEL